MSGRNLSVGSPFYDPISGRRTNTNKVPDRIINTFVATCVGLSFTVPDGGKVPNGDEVSEPTAVKEKAEPFGDSAFRCRSIVSAGNPEVLLR